MGSIIKLGLLIFFSPVILFAEILFIALKLLKYALPILIKAAKLFLSLSAIFIIWIISAIVTFGLTIYALRKEFSYDYAVDFLESLLPATERPRRKNFAFIFTELANSISDDIFTKFDNERLKVKDFVMKLYYHD